MTASRRRPGAVLVALVLALAALTGCSTTVAGSGALAPPRGGSDVRTANQLATLLMEVPAGATGSTSAFDADRTPTLDEFSNGYYAAGAGSSYLRKRGVTAVAHEGWTATDGNAAEVVLFLFDTKENAYSWMAGETSALREAGALRATIDALPAVVGYMFTQYAGGGSQDRRYYAIQGRVGMAFDFFNPPHTGLAQAPDWVGAQYARLT